MSPTYKHIKKNHESGYSLTELLVAMVIFLTVISGVVALYGGATRMMAQVNSAVTNTEIGRSTLESLQRDLRTAFTARELGRYYQFYGRPEGFTFVGTLSSGELGRITYVIHPDVGEEGSTVTMRTEIWESWDEMRKRVMSQAGHWALKAGLDVTETNSAIAAAETDFAHPVTGAYPIPGDVTELTEFVVQATTYSLLRYEEAGVADLDTFPLPLGLTWPDIDPDPPDANASLWDVYDGAEAGVDLYRELLSAINPAPTSYTLDMRYLLLEIQSRSGPQANTVGPEVVGDLIAAKRREIWIRMLSGDSSLPSGLGAGFWGGVGRPLAADYVVAERILYQAQLINPNTGAPMYLPVFGRPVDALMLRGIFTYGDGSGEYRESFNDNDNVEILGDATSMSYREYMANPSEAALLEFDDTLTRIKESTLTDPMMGSPLNPRIPTEVVPGFYVMSEKPTISGRDFRRWFTQSIDVPCAFTRTAL